MLGTILLHLLIAAWQVPKMYQKKQYRDIFFFFLFWASSGIYSLLIVLEIKFTDPVELIHQGLEAVARLLGY
ncbi:MAG: hypothetical protein ACOCZM_03390 [Bacillota bacterium]